MKSNDDGQAQRLVDLRDRGRLGQAGVALHEVVEQGRERVDLRRAERGREDQWVGQAGRQVGPAGDDDLAAGAAGRDRQVEAAVVGRRRRRIAGLVDAGAGRVVERGGALQVAQAGMIVPVVFLALRDRGRGRLRRRVAPVGSSARSRDVVAAAHAVGGRLVRLREGLALWSHGALGL